MTNEESPAGRRLDSEALTRRALELHGMKYNCAQSLVCTLAPLVGADEDLCFRATEALGSGMGGFSETCGALTGAVVIVGLANSNGKDDPTSKAASYRIARQMVADFRAEAGATLCHDLKGIGTGRPLRSCNDCIALGMRLAAGALEAAGKTEGAR